MRAGVRQKDNLPVVVKMMKRNSHEARLLFWLNTCCCQRNHTIPLLDIHVSDHYCFMVMPLYTVLNSLDRKDRTKYFDIRDQIIEVSDWARRHQ